MAIVSRLAGALLVSTGERHFLVGNTKEPCDWGAAGFAAPERVDAVRRPVLELARTGPVTLECPRLRIDGDGERAARMLAERMLIHRNGSVSERLWRLVTGADDLDDDPPEAAEHDAGWLVQAPPRVWELVRDTVLRCS